MVRYEVCGKTLEMGKANPVARDHQLGDFYLMKVREGPSDKWEVGGTEGEKGPEWGSPSGCSSNSGQSHRVCERLVSRHFQAAPSRGLSVLCKEHASTCHHHYHCCIITGVSPC